MSLCWQNGLPSLKWIIWCHTILSILQAWEYTPFIDLNGKGRRSPVYKNDFTIDKDGVSVCHSLMPDTDALFIWLWKIIQGCSTIRQGAVKYNVRTSTEYSNKRKKLDFKLEDGRHCSTKMWCCRLYHILMLQYLDAWDLPPVDYYISFFET